MAKKKSKFYVVWKGYRPGVYTTWDECYRQVHGFEGAVYKSFPSKSTAEDAFQGNYEKYIGRGKANAKASGTSKPTTSSRIIKKSISVDASSMGNPGIMEYRGVETDTGREIFRQGPFPLGTNNIGEFLALVHGLAMLQKQGLTKLPIYSDSKIAMGWVKKKKAKTTLIENKKTKKLHDLIQRAEMWLAQNHYENPILKWKTESWGEIPADFGRK